MRVSGNKEITIEIMAYDKRNCEEIAMCYCYCYVLLLLLLCIARCYRCQCNTKKAGAQHGKPTIQTEITALDDKSLVEMTTDKNNQKKLNEGGHDLYISINIYIHILFAAAMCEM